MRRLEGKDISELDNGFIMNISYCVGLEICMHVRLYTIFKRNHHNERH